ncbi:hypothetical protein F4678DRAFT_456179 [Xylaria arbuscula]|nr:hypothetical protein F4678DRAFT_456179 [Xylaria arbuscula]
MATPMALPPPSSEGAIDDRHIGSPPSILFTIPLEILHLIVGCVASNKGDLASLALVNSTCRQLVRPSQFRNLHLDCSGTALQVLTRLQEEAVQIDQPSDSTTVLASLGAHVRHLRLDTAGLPQTVPPPQKEAIIAHCLESFSHHIRPTVFLALPHLQSLTMRMCTIDDNLLDCLMQLPIKYLELQGQFPSMPQLRKARDSCSLKNLETLCIETYWSRQVIHEAALDPSDFYKSLLAACCSNLTYLDISHTKAYRGFMGTGQLEKPLSFNIEFPKLRGVRIRNMTTVDTQVLSSLVREGLTSLSIPYYDNFSELGHISTLDAVILEACEMTGSGIPIIEMNPQISSLKITGAPVEFLGRVVDSLYQHNNLKCLSLEWEQNNIPEASLEKISLLSSIEVLSLITKYVGTLPMPRINWDNRYFKIREFVGRLSRLRHLCIRDDHFVWTLLDESDNDGETGQGFPDLHKSRMLVHATAYVQSLPLLELIHIGYLTFAVTENNGVRQPVSIGGT